MRPALLVMLLIALSAATDALAQGGSLKGSIAYSAEMGWDYNKDGKRDRVQYWIDLDIVTDGKTVKGVAVRYLKNVVTGEKRYAPWGFDMTGENARRPQDVTKLVISGNIATFTVHDIDYTVKDSSAYSPSEKPTYVMDDGLVRQEMPIYGGRLTVQSH